MDPNGIKWDQMGVCAKGGYPPKGGTPPPFGEHLQMGSNGGVRQGGATLQKGVPPSVKLANGIKWGYPPFGKTAEGVPRMTFHFGPFVVKAGGCHSTS